MKNLTQTQKKAVISIMAISIVLLLGQLTGSIIAYIMVSYPDVPDTTVTSIMTLPGLIGLFASFAVGPLAMKLSKKLLLLISGSCLVIYFAIFAFIGANGPFSMLLVAACFAGICQGTAMTLTSSVISEFVGAANSASYVAISGALSNGGGAIINIIGGTIASAGGGANWSNAYYLGFIIVPVLIFFAIYMPSKPDTDPMEIGQGGPEGAPPPPSGGIPAKVFAIIILGVFMSIAICAFLFNISNYIILEYQLGSSAQAGLANSLFTITGMLVGFTYPMWAKLLKKWVVVVGYSCFAIGLFILMAVNTTIVGPYLSAIILGFGMNVSNPYIMATIMQLTPPKLIPMSMSIFMGGINLSMFFALNILNFLGGLLGGGMRNTIMISVIIAVIATVISVFLYVLAKDKEKVQA